MSISYTEALSIVHTVAQAKKCKTTAEEGVQLAAALGRRASRDVRSPINTPMFDSSAMDGYAVSSALTSNASATNALELRVEGTIAAGDPPQHLPCNVDGQGRIACVEIMTGAPFPQSSFGPEFDACIPWEHTHALPSTCDPMKMIKLTRPPKHNQHRRFAGHDFRRADMIVKKGDEIEPHHIMAMASVGLEIVYVHKRIRVTVITTGSELQEPRLLISDVMPSRLPDCNGPFLRASLHTLGIQVNAITGVSDDIEELRTQFSDAVSSQHCDALITTGGVSAGKFDFVPEAIMQLGGSVHFRHVAMRPGHPVLFASLPTDIRDGTTGNVPLFALPGNPVATAACYRFLVVPYLRAFFGQTSEVPLCDMKISAAAHDVRNDEIVYRKDKKLDVFRHGQMCGDKVALSNEQSPGKVKPFACANCWVHLGVGISEVRPGDKANCYPLHSSTCFKVG